MTIDEMAQVLAKVQLIDNREVSRLVLIEWQDEIGDLLTMKQAMDAVRRFRRERPGVYLEPGHLLELAEVVAESNIPDITDQIIEASKQRMLAAAGVTESEYLEHTHDLPWLRAHFPTAFEQQELLSRYPDEEIPDE